MIGSERGRMNRKAQQIIEYLLLVASAMIVFLAVSGPTGMIRWRVEDSINRTIDIIKADDPNDPNVYDWKPFACDCGVLRDCVYPGASEITVSCNFRCVNGAGAVVDDFNCIDQLGYRPSSSKGCGNQPCCGIQGIQPAYGEQCDVSAGFTKTCVNVHGAASAGNQWAGSMACVNCQEIDTCVQVENQGAPACMDGRLYASEQCDKVNGRVVINPSMVPGGAINCTDHMYDSGTGIYFTGGLLDCKDDAGVCKVDTSTCKWCDAWSPNTGQCGTNPVESSPNPLGVANCLRNGTYFSTRTCRSGGPTGLVTIERACKPDTSCGNQCGSAPANVTLCPLTVPYSFKVGARWTYVDDVTDCTAGAVCQAYCTGEQVVLSNRARSKDKALRGVCGCKVTNTGFDGAICACTSPRVGRADPDMARDVYDAWQDVLPDVYDDAVDGTEVPGGIDAILVADTCNKDKRSHFICVPTDSFIACVDVAVLDSSRDTHSWTTRTVTCVNPPTDDPGNPIKGADGTKCATAEADTTPLANRTDLYACAAAAEGTFTDISACVTQDPGEGGVCDTYVALSAGAGDGTCAVEAATDTCPAGGDINQDYTCIASNALTCTDLNCTTNFMTEFTKYQTRSVTCYSPGADTCPAFDVSAKFECPNGLVQKCRDVDYSRTKEGQWRNINCL